MKASEYKNIVEYYYTKSKDGVWNRKGITICIAKECNEPLYHNKSTSNPKYCMRCG